MHRLLSIFVLALCFPLFVFAAEPLADERWFIVNMQGQRAGWMRTKSTTSDTRIDSETEMKLTIKRGAVSIGIRTESAFAETAAGKPISMKSTMQLGAMPTTTEYRFEADGVHVTEIIGKAGKPTDKDVQPMPEGEFLTPAAAERAMVAKIAAGEKEITIRTLQPETALKPINTTHTLLERTTLDVVGKTIPALKWTTTTDAFPGLTSTDYTDERGEPVRTETTIGGIKLEVILADRDLALAKADPPELLVNTLIKPDKAIDNSRTLRRAVYVLESTDDKLPDIISDASQRFERISEKSGRLTVDLDAVAAAPAGEVGDKQFTECSNMVSCADEKVKALATQAIDKAGLGKTAPAAERVEAFRAFVHNYIDKKSLDVGFASAAEVARTRSGDCSEHGVLLCALMRADGIPSRVVSGLVYVDSFAGQDNIFGYHMWAQALVQKDGATKWSDVDAALSPTEPFDATHITLAPTSLADGDMANSLVRLAPLIGTLKIRVEETK